MSWDDNEWKSLFHVNLKYGISMFLLVYISVNHTNTIFKISLRILLTWKSLSTIYSIRRITDNRTCGAEIAKVTKNTTANSLNGLGIKVSSNTNRTNLKTDTLNRVGRFHPLLRATIMNKNTKNIIDRGIALNSTNGWNVNCIKYLKWQLLDRIWYASHLRSSNYMIQLTHSMLPLSLLILGCYTCSINRYQYTSIADLSSERDNGSCRICNIECTSTSIVASELDMKWTKWNGNENRELATICTNWIEDVDVSATILLESLKNECNEWLKTKSNDSRNDYFKDVAEDLYSCDSKTFISNMVNITKNIIIPLINGTGSIVPIMIIFCIRDSLREYKSNYVIML